MRSFSARTAVPLVALLAAGTSSLAPRPSRAQSAAAPAVAMTGVPAVDSAAVARAAWQSASRALANRDPRAATSEVARAARAWPTQPAYLWGRAVVAMQSADT